MTETSFLDDKKADFLAAVDAALPGRRMQLSVFFPNPEGLPLRLTRYETMRLSDLQMAPNQPM
jgi:hypothetical protein